MSSLNELFGPAQPVAPASQINELVFDGREGFPYIGVGMPRLTASLMDAVLQSYGPVDPQAKITASATGTYETQNANLTMAGNTITLVQPDGQPYRYDQTSGSAKLLRIDYDLGFTPQEPEYARLSILTEESGTIARWTSGLSTEIAGGVVTAFTRRLGSLWVLVEVTGAGNRNQQGIAQLLIRGLLFESVECPVDFGEGQPVRPVLSSTNWNVNVTALRRNIGVEMLLTDPLTIQAEVISIDDD
jgi:hypothetical protein